MRSKGKNYDKWQKVRSDFLAANPPNHEGYYTCYLCRQWIPAEEITVDHVVPRSRAPNLRYDFSNFAFCCGSCNAAKGSKVVNHQQEDYIEDTELDGLW